MNKVNKLKLPCYWASNKKAWMNSTLFENWYRHHFIPSVKWYCKQKKIDFKILLIVDNCTAHPVLAKLLVLLGIKALENYEKVVSK